MKQHYRTFNIKSEELSARRRLRHDARGAAPPLRAAGEGGAAGREPSPPISGLPEIGSPRTQVGTPDLRAGGAGVGARGRRGLIQPSPAADPQACRRRTARCRDPHPDPSPQGGGEQDADAFPAWPDLVLIDGGKGQLEAARAGAGGDRRRRTCALVGIAKGRDRDAGRETFFMPGQPPLQAAAARSGALFRAAPARRGAPLRHRRASGQAQARDGEEPARRDPGHRPERASAPSCTISAPSRRSSAPPSRTSIKTPGVNAATARAVYDFFHAGRG